MNDPYIWVKLKLFHAHYTYILVVISKLAVWWNVLPNELFVSPITYCSATIHYLLSYFKFQQGEEANARGRFY